jgi:uncharacterized protein YjlB
MSTTPEVLTFHFKDAGDIPNHPHLPALVYKRGAPALNDADAIARWFETEWPKHGWRSAWRWGVYDFPHYHSTAHEVLGVYRGHATIRLGGNAGVTIRRERAGSGFLWLQRSGGRNQPGLVVFTDSPLRPGGSRA